MRTLGSIVIGLSAACLAGCGAQRTLLGTESTYLLTAMDALAVPGESVDLRAQLRGGDLLQGQPGYAVRFRRGGEVFKVAETDADGVAIAAFTPDGAGDHEFTAEIAPAGLSSEPPEPAPLTVACRAPDEPMVVVDMDKTVVASGFHEVLVGSPKPMAGSQDVLAELAKQHTIVYLTHRPDFFRRKSRTFLVRHGFPDGPLLLSTPEGFLSGSEAFKSAQIARLRESFSNIEIGIGDKIGDARAYEKNGLRAFCILPPPGPDATAEDILALADELDTLQPDTHVVDTWDEIAQALAGKASFPPAAKQKELRALAERRAAQQRAAEEGTQ